MPLKMSIKIVYGSMTERGVVAGFSIKPVSEMVAHSESTSQNKCMYEND